MTALRARLPASVAQALADALSRTLVGRRVDRVWRVGESGLMIRWSGREKRRLILDASAGWPRGALVRAWPETPDRPDRVALNFRTAIEGALVQSIAFVDARWLHIELAQGEARHHLVAQWSGRAPELAALSDTAPTAEGNDAPLAVLWGGRPVPDIDAPPLRDAPWPDALPRPTVCPDGDPAATEAADAEWLAAAALWSQGVADDQAAETVRQGLLKAIRRALKRAKRRLQALQKDLDRAEGSADDLRIAELLKGALGHINDVRGQESVRVQDWFAPDTPWVEVPLSPERTPREEMERRFTRHRRYSRALSDIETRTLDAMAALERLEHARASADAMETLGPDAKTNAAHALQGDLNSVLKAAASKPQNRPGAKNTQSATLPYSEFRARDGTSILVGKNARHNDALTFHVARGRDIWLHARDTSGSHVIVRCAKNEPPGAEALLDAATLAAWHSRSRKEAIVDVMWTERKHVRRVPGAGPGRVHVSAPRTLIVRVEAERITRLYADRPDGA